MAAQLTVEAQVGSLPWELPHAKGVAINFFFKNVNTQKHGHGCSFFFFFLLFLLFKAAPAACESSQARGLIGVVPASLHHGHSIRGPESHL